ncbi:hypothetical protein ANTPLA_LOCUS8140 [Anthophora plagiata]
MRRTLNKSGQVATLGARDKLRIRFMVLTRQIHFKQNELLETGPFLLYLPRKWTTRAPFRSPQSSACPQIIAKRIHRDGKKVRYANAMFSRTPDAEYVYSHVKTSMLHPQFLDKSREKRAYSFCKNYPNSFHDTLIP